MGTAIPTPSFNRPPQQSAIDRGMRENLRPDAAAVSGDSNVRRSLGRYLAVMQNEKPAKFAIAKRLVAEFSEHDSVEVLWPKHAELTRQFSSVERTIDSGQVSLPEIQAPAKSYLDLKIAIASRMLSNCHLCARKCGINRTEGKVGYCRCGLQMVVSGIFEHMGEEPELVPSGTVFTMGCTMRCRHCQNYTISQWIEDGEAYKAERLAKEIERLRNGGCRNVNLVGGEPTPWLQQWLEVFKHVDVNVPVVWNSNAYYSPEVAQLLAGFADVCLLDFKYGPGNCAERISDAPSYWEACTRNHLKAKDHGELIIRVLVLPGHLECCVKPTMTWVAENLGRDTRVNIMFQYRPEWRASEVPELRKRLTTDEKKMAVRLASEAGLFNVLT